MVFRLRALLVSGPRRSRIGRAAAAALVVALGLAAARTGAAVDATYATYMRIHGDWTVLCGFDEPTGGQRCDLRAPPPRLGATRSKIHVAGGGGGETVVRVTVGHPIEAGSPVFLRVDANPPHRIQPSRTGEAEWRGEDAARILAELENGRGLVLRSFAGATAEPRDEWYSLELFGQALGDYRSKTGS